MLSAAMPKGEIALECGFNAESSMSGSNVFALLSPTAQPRIPGWKWSTAVHIQTLAFLSRPRSEAHRVHPLAEYAQGRKPPLLFHTSVRQRQNIQEPQQHKAYCRNLVLIRDYT